MTIIRIVACNGCPFVKQRGPCCEHWVGCSAPGGGGRMVDDESDEMPTWCPLLDGDITIGVVGDGDE